MFSRKKVLLALFGFVLIQSICFAEIAGSRFRIREANDDFDVVYYQTDEMKSVKAKKNNDVAVTQAFALKRGKLKGELRYSLFTDMGGDEATLPLDYSMWVFMCLNNALGYEVSLDSLSVFNNADVKKEFNGDFGCTGFYKSPKSEYGKGYEYMAVEFFYKKNQGLVMRSFLFNDLEFAGITAEGGIAQDSVWLQNYHTFAFMDKE